MATSRLATAKVRAARRSQPGLIRPLRQQRAFGAGHFSRRGPKPVHDPFSIAVSNSRHRARHIAGVAHCDDARHLAQLRLGEGCQPAGSSLLLRVVRNELVDAGEERTRLVVDALVRLQEGPAPREQVARGRRSPRRQAAQRPDRWSRGPRRCVRFCRRPPQTGLPAARRGLRTSGARRWRRGTAIANYRRRELRCRPGSDSCQDQPSWNVWKVHPFNSRARRSPQPYKLIIRLPARRVHSTDPRTANTMPVPNFGATVEHFASRLAADHTALARALARTARPAARRAKSVMFSRATSSSTTFPSCSRRLPATCVLRRTRRSPPTRQ